MPSQLKIRARRVTGARVAVALLLAIGVVAGSVGAGLATLDTRSAPPLDRVSNQGTPVTAGSEDAKALERLEATAAEVSLLGSRGSDSFYRVGDGCYAMGPSGPVARRLGQIICTGDFPSKDRPVLDFTVLHRSTTGEMRIWRSAGITADGVATVAFRTEAGDLVSRVNVSDNVYAVPSPPAAGASEFVAFDSQGTLIYAKPATARR